MAGEKRSQEIEEAQRNENIVLVDIEGTTTSISFVKETLFPYVREHLKDYIEKNWENAEFKEDLEKLKEQAKKDETDKVEGLIAITTGTPEEEKETLVKNILWQMDNDRKTGALKQLQGHMWREAYKSGAVKGHVYDDVPKALESWTASNKKIYIYSSGSVESQKLLFAHSTHGDLLKHFTDHFDTEVGPKQEASSYKTIISKLSVEPSQVLFLTDIPKEAKAAVDSGISAILVTRDGNAALSIEEKSTYPTIQTFLDITFQTPVKRQKVDEPTPPAPKVDEKKIEDPKKPDAEPEDVEMTDLSDKKSEKEVNPKESKSTPEAEIPKKSTESTEPSTETPKEPEISPEKPPALEKVDEPEKMEIEKIAESKSPKDEVKPVEPEEKTPEVESKVEAKVDTKVSSTPEKPEEKPEEAKPEVELKKVEVEEKKKPDVEEKSTTEVVKSDESTKIDEKMVEQVAEKSEKNQDKPDKSLDSTDDTVKADDNKVDKENGDQVKQNGDSKIEISIEETKVVVKTNGDSKKEETVKEPEDKESVKEVKEVKDVQDVKDVKDVKDIDDEKKDKKDKDDEKKDKNDKSEEKKVNGNSDIDESHRNRNDVNETTKNGESSDDKDTIKVKKVVDSIVDGAAEPEVVPPVAVVAATS